MYSVVYIHIMYVMEPELVGEVVGDPGYRRFGCAAAGPRVRANQLT